MNASQLYSILMSDDAVRESGFLGVFPVDLIPLAALKFPCSLVINTKPHTHPGEHWILAIKSAEDRKGYLFDSFGRTSFNLPEVGEIFENCEDFWHNEIAFQSPHTTTCGQYVVFFLTHFARGYSTANIQRLLFDCGDKAAQDAFIWNWLRETYSPADSSLRKVPVVDFPFILDQIAAVL